MTLRDTSSPARKTSSGEFQMHPLGFLAALALTLGVGFLSFLTVEFFKLAIRLPEPPVMPWLSEYYYHIALFCYAYLGILLLRRGHPGAYGIRSPEGNSYVLVAIVIGIVFGTLTMAFEYWPQLHGVRDYSQQFLPTPLNIAGWVAFSGIVVGISQETMFRGFLLSYLTRIMPGRVEVGGLSMNGAGLVAASVYAVFVVLYSEKFFKESFLLVLGQLLCTFVLGVFFAYWFEKSKSLLGPIVGHNAAALTEQVLVFALLAHHH